MKCPKCGYNSFEYYDTCTKCSNDLTGFKGTYGLKSIVLPLEVRTAMAESMMAETANQVADAVDAPNDMFSFDLPEETTTAGGSTTVNDDPFNFDDDPAAATAGGGEFSFSDDPAAQEKAEKDAFADLLESTSQSELDAFPGAPAAPAAAEASTGEFDMNNFSWDEPAPAAGGAAAKPADDDFNSLFGDKDDDKK